MTRRLIESGSTFEREIGYSRAVVDDEWIFVSGTTGFDYSSMTISDSLVEQTEQCLRNIQAALAEAGAALADVVRVRYILPDGSTFPQCWPVLRRHFGDVRPAATMISAGLADPRMKMESKSLRGAAAAEGRMDSDPIAVAFAELYAAFNARDIDAVLARFAPDVDWPNGMEGGRVRGHEAVRAYWTRQWSLVNPTVNPTVIASGSAGRVVVTVHQIVRSLSGEVLKDQHVQHLYQLRAGMIVRMDIEDGPFGESGTPA